MRALAPRAPSQFLSSIRRINYRVLKLKAEIDHFLYVTGRSAKQLSMAVFHSPGVVYDILADRRIPQQRTRRRLENFMLKADGSIRPPTPTLRLPRWPTSRRPERAEVMDERTQRARQL